MDLGVSGLASGFDWRSLVDQLADVERLPQSRLRTEQQQLRSRNTAYGSLVTELKSLQSKASELKEPNLFLSRSTSVDDPTLARASVLSGAVQGTFTFQFTQLATAARQLGQAGAGKALSTTDDVTSLVLSDAGFSAGITAGTFSVNGKQVSVAPSDTLQQVFDNINSATGGAVSGSYDAVSDRIVLTSAGEIVLGSATDTSNFLQATKLNNNGSGTITSSGELGGIRLAASLGSANFSTALTDDGAGQGSFKINGVAVAWSTTDSVSDVLKRINDSGAGVLASYDTINDRFVVTNKTTGDMGMALEDVTGNFLAASRLGAGSLERGKDLLYSVNGGGQLRSHSNTVSEDTSGITGLTVTALKEGAAATVSVTSDTDTIKKALAGFIEQYNKVQTLIDSQTAVTTAADGKVTAGTLANESEVNELAGRLRGLTFGTAAGLGSTLDRLEKLGYDSNSDDNSLALKNAETLDQVLRDNPGAVSDLFTHGTSGLATKLDSFLKQLVGDDGSLLAKQDSLTRQASGIDTQVSDLERLVQSNRQAMIDRFVAMEEAQAQISQQLQFLKQNLGIT